MQKEDKREIAYKLVDVENGEYFSSSARQEFQLNYAVEKITKPKIGKLFVFKRLKDAKIFAPYAGHRILRCKVTNLKKKRVIFAWECVLDCWSEQIKKFWKTTGRKGIGDHLRSSPEGTYVCDSCEPIGVVE